MLKSRSEACLGVGVEERLDVFSSDSSELGAFETERIQEDL